MINITFDLYIRLNTQSWNYVHIQNIIQKFFDIKIEQKMLIKKICCLKINTHNEKGTIPSFRIGCLIWWTRQKIKKEKSQRSLIPFKGDNEYKHGLWTPRGETDFTARPKIQSQSQIFRYGQSIFCLPHRPDFLDIFDWWLHWVSVVRDFVLQS